MKGLRIFLATFAITLTLGALAQDSSIPSRPRFLSVGVGTAAGSTNGRITATENIVTTGGQFSGSGAGLTSIPAANLTGTLPAISGANLTSLNATNISSGALNNARLPSAISVTSLAGSGSGITALNGSNITSGIVDEARIDSDIARFSATTTGPVRSGCSSGGSPTVRLMQTGWNVSTARIITVRLQAFTCTSNATTLTLDTSAIPAGWRPSVNVSTGGFFCTDNGSENPGCSVIVLSNGQINIHYGLNAGTFTASGTKGIARDVTFSYLID